MTFIGTRIQSSTFRPGLLPWGRLFTVLRSLHVPSESGRRHINMIFLCSMYLDKEYFSYGKFTITIWGGIFNMMVLCRHLYISRKFISFHVFWYLLIMSCITFVVTADIIIKYNVLFNTVEAKKKKNMLSSTSKVFAWFNNQCF